MFDRTVTVETDFFSFCATDGDWYWHKQNLLLIFPFESKGGGKKDQIVNHKFARLSNQNQAFLSELDAFELLTEDWG